LDSAALKSYVSVLGVLAISLASSWAYWYGLPLSTAFVVGAVVVGIVFAVTEAFPIHVSEHWEMTALDVALVAAVVLLGPLWAAVAALPCAVLVGRRDLLRTAYEAGRNTVEIFLAGMVFSLLASEPLLSGVAGASNTTSVVYATFAAAATLLAANHAMHAGLLKVKYSEHLSDTFENHIQPYLPSDALSVLTTGIGVLALLTYGPVAALVLVGGSIGGQALIYSTRESQAKRRALEEENLKLKKALSGSAKSFGYIVLGEIGRKDGYTDRHAAATATYARDIAVELGFGEERAERVWTAGLLHNIGLFGLPSELHGADGKLNSVARRQYEEHPVRGQRMLAHFEESGGFDDIGEWIRWHHERPDGRGYPDRLRGTWMPVESKIISVAEAYAAMVLDSPKRPGIRFEVARTKLTEEMGSRFDEPVTKAFLRNLDTSGEGYRLADDDRFIPPETDSPYPAAHRSLPS
jgi:HD-GYP domain-containing protein (c-di-GMP phosphodiesterase class II)